jgi:hypothetical protein
MAVRRDFTRSSETVSMRSPRSPLNVHRLTVQLVLSCQNSVFLQGKVSFSYPVIFTTGLFIVFKIVVEDCQEFWRTDHLQIATVIRRCFRVVQLEISNYLRKKVNLGNLCTISPGPTNDPLTLDNNDVKYQPSSPVLKGF